MLKDMATRKDHHVMGTANHVVCTKVIRLLVWKNVGIVEGEKTHGYYQVQKD